MNIEKLIKIRSIQENSIKAINEFEKKETIAELQMIESSIVKINTFFNDLINKLPGCVIFKTCDGEFHFINTDKDKYVFFKYGKLNDYVILNTNGFSTRKMFHNKTYSELRYYLLKTSNSNGNKIYNTEQLNYIIKHWDNILLDFEEAYKNTCIKNIERVANDSYKKIEKVCLYKEFLDKNIDDAISAK